MSACAAGAQLAFARHRRRQADAAAAAAARQRALRRGGGGDRRGDAGHDFAFDAGGGERFELFFEPAEHARVAALEAHDALAHFARVLDEQRVDRRLAGAVAEAALADVDPVRLRRELAQRRVGERIEQHDVGLREQARAPRTVIRSAAPGPAPMKMTRPFMVLWVLCHGLDEQRAAGAVARRVDDDQRAADAVRRVGLDRQRLLRLDDDLADLVDGELVRVGRVQRVDVERGSRSR